MPDRQRTEALSEASLLRALDVLAQTLDGRQDLGREVHLKVCRTGSPSISARQDV